jgi:hypothetical protein
VRTFKHKQKEWGMKNYAKGNEKVVLKSMKKNSQW